MIAVLIYLLTVLFAYSGVRRELIKNKWNATSMEFVIIFIPFMNVGWGVGAWISVLSANRYNGKLKKFYNVFFRLK